MRLRDWCNSSRVYGQQKWDSNAGMQNPVIRPFHKLLIHSCLLCSTILRSITSLTQKHYEIYGMLCNSNGCIIAGIKTFVFDQGGAALLLCWGYFKHRPTVLHHLIQVHYARLQTSNLKVANAQQIRPPILSRRIHETSNRLGISTHIPPHQNQPKTCKTSGTPHELGFKQSVVSIGQSTPDLSKWVPGWRKKSASSRQEHQFQ